MHTTQSIGAREYVVFISANGKHRHNDFPEYDSKAANIGVSILNI